MPVISVRLWCYVWTGIWLCPQSTAMVVDVTDARYGRCWEFQKLGKAGWPKNLWPSSAINLYEHTGHIHICRISMDLSWALFSHNGLQLMHVLSPRFSQLMLAGVWRGHMLGMVSFLHVSSLLDLRKDAWSNGKSGWWVATSTVYEWMG